MKKRDVDDAERCARGGLVGGLLGGGALGVLMSLRSAQAHRDVWRLLKLPALPWLGDKAIEPGFALGPVALGLLTHLGLALSWGLLFGICFYGLSRRSTLIAAPLFGVVTWLTMSYVVLPVFGLADLVRNVPPALLVSEHLLFAFAVAVGFLPFQRPADAATVRAFLGR